MNNTRELDLQMHDRRRRAENRGDGLRASLSLHQEERAARARATDAVESPLARLQRQADETLGNYHAATGTHEVAYDEDGNEIEDGESNFGFVENEEERQWDTTLNAKKNTGRLPQTRSLPQHSRRTNARAQPGSAWNWRRRLSA